jgi:hypothetical protein
MNRMSMVLGGLKVRSKYLAVSKEIIGRIGIIMNKATVAPVRTLVMPPISKMPIEPHCPPEETDNHR